MIQKRILIAEDEKPMANACAEEALRQIRDSTSFTGTGNLALGQGTCTYTVADDGGENRTITASGAVAAVMPSTRRSALLPGRKWRISDET